MLKLDIPGIGAWQLEILVLDYNGTLALDGELLKIEDEISHLAEILEIHIITSDTFGSVRHQYEGLPVTVRVLETDNHTLEKAEYLNLFGVREVVAIGNGANDQLMLEKARLGIVVVGDEGCSAKTLLSADVAVKSIHEAFGLLRNPKRLVATVRR